MKFHLLYLLLVSAVLAGCTPARRDQPNATPNQDEEAVESGSFPYRKNAGVLPRRAEEISGQAVISLLNQARVERDSGRMEQAMAALERAQRIEPRNPFIWQQLAATHLAQRRLLEAENLAQRSNSLARGNPYIEIENWRTIAAARLARGDSAGVEEAQARMAQMQDAIDR